MLFRRIAAHVQAQNWTAVFLDFLIVVVGVFIGIQVANWNEGRLDRKREKAALERLFEEAQEAVTVIHTDVKQTAVRIQNQHAMAQLISSQEPLPKNLEAETNGFISLEFYPSIRPVRTTYDEITAAGQMQLIRSRHVREAVAAYYAQLGFFEQQLDYFRAFSVSAGYYIPVAARAHVRYHYNPDHAVSREAVIDWQGLRADAELTSLLVSKLRNQIVMQHNRAALLESAQRMCKTLATAASCTCHLPAVSTTLAQH